jgi:lipopolysaccharide biosynthesis glycosyltransferase
MEFAVAFCADRNMEVPLHVAASSVLAKMAQHCTGVFYFLLADFSERQKGELRRTLDLADVDYRAEFLKEPPASLLAGLRPFHGNLTPYHRLALPEMVAADRLLYIDSDTVCSADVSLLATIAMSHPSGFVPHGVTDDCIERERFASIGLPADTPAFNSGVMLFDLRAWRDQRLTEQTLGFCRKYQEYDQTALIAMCGGKFEPLDCRYNIALYTNTPPPDTESHPGIYHFVGSPKPWDIGGRQFHSSFPIYAQALAKTVWKRHTTNYMSFAQWRRAYKVKGGYARKLLYLGRQRWR